MQADMQANGRQAADRQKSGRQTGRWADRQTSGRQATADDGQATGRQAPYRRQIGRQATEVTNTVSKAGHCRNKFVNVKPKPRTFTRLFVSIANHDLSESQSSCIRDADIYRCCIEGYQEFPSPKKTSLNHHLTNSSCPCTSSVNHIRDRKLLPGYNGKLLKGKKIVCWPRRLVIGR